MKSDRDILYVEVDGKRLLMSRLAVRLAKFPVTVLSVYQKDPDIWERVKRIDIRKKAK